jgi:hypothetical protein
MLRAFGFVALVQLASLALFMGALAAFIWFGGRDYQ